MAAAPHEADGQIGEEDEMDQGNDQAFGERAGQLTGNATYEIGAGSFEESDRAGEGIVREADIRINETKVLSGGMSGKLMTGELFSIPVSGERLRWDEPDTRIALRNSSHAFGGAVGGMIVENEDLEPCTRAIEDGFKARQDVFLFIPGGDENGDEWRGLV
jgi:hypothetical protein